MGDIQPLKGVYDDFVKIIDSCVVKYNKKAKVNETLEITRNAEQYITALYNEDTFFSYMTYDEDLLKKVGITDESDIERYMENRRNIPTKYHDELLVLKRKRVIENYIERNNYYRTLNGLPNIEEDEFDYIYISKSEYGMNDIPEDVPIHELDDYKITILNEVGILDNIKEKYPNKEYLNYLGSNKISIATARRAKNFELLRIPNNISDSLKSNFSTIYEQCRYYFMNVIYVQEYTDVIPYYDNFISLCIMVMAMQQVVSRAIEVTINRDFFDGYMVRLLYESYGIPYIAELPSSVQSELVHNLNLLIQYKSTDKVLYDIAAILGYDSIAIYKYYLMKEQKFDESGNPVIKTKMEINQYGEEEEVPDYEAMYDIYFRQVELSERDYFKALQNKSNTSQYDEITSNDPYWWEDDSLYQMLYASEYNYVESKYLSMSISYRLTEVMFETIYLIRMLFDKKTEIANIRVAIPKIYEDGSVSLFDCIVALSAILSKKNNLKGEILMTPSKILHVLGFNFKQDFDTIRQHIKDDKYLDNEMLKYLENMTAYTVDSVNNLYRNIKDLRDFMSEKMASSTNIYEYRAYVKLYEALYISEENQEIFRISNYTNDKEFAETYLEYLKYTNPKLYEAINEAEGETLTGYAQHMIAKLTSVIEDIRHLNVVSDMDSYMLDALLTLVRFFKSYTTDMLGINIVYIFDTKALNMLKLIDHITYMEKEIGVYEKFELTHMDFISLISAYITHDEKLLLKESYKVISKCYLPDDLIFKETISIIATVLVNDRLSLYDTIGLLSAYINHKDPLILTDDISMKAEMEVIDNLLLKDNVDINALLELPDDIRLYDAISIVFAYITHNEKLLLKEVCTMFSSFGITDKFKLTDTVYSVVNSIVSDKVVVNDIVGKIISYITTGDSVLLNDICEIISDINTPDKMTFADKIKIISEVIVKNKFTLYDNVGDVSKTIRVSDRLHMSDTANIKS